MREFAAPPPESSGHFFERGTHGVCVRLSARFVPLRAIGGSGCCGVEQEKYRLPQQVAALTGLPTLAACMCTCAYVLFAVGGLVAMVSGANSAKLGEITVLPPLEYKALMRIYL